MSPSRVLAIYRRMRLLREIAERLVEKGEYREAHNINHEVATIANELFLAGYRDVEAEE